MRGVTRRGLALEPRPTRGPNRVNVGGDRETFNRLVGSLGDPDYAAFDRFVPHPIYAKQRWISILNPSRETVHGYERLARRR